MQALPGDRSGVRGGGARNHPLVRAAADRRPGDDPRGSSGPAAARPRIAALTVISTASRWWDWWPEWSRMQDELAALSSDSVHRTAVKAGHNVHLDEPLLVVQAIRDFVDRCRG